MLDQKVIGHGFSIHFTISHADKAIEIQEEGDESEKNAASMNKKYRHNIVMKSSTFASLRRFSDCISARIVELLNKLPSWNSIMEDILGKFGESFHNNESRTLDPAILREIIEKHCTQLSACEIEVICSEIIYLNFVANNFLIDVSDYV